MNEGDYWVEYPDNSSAMFDASGELVATITREVHVYVCQNAFGLGRRIFDTHDHAREFVESERARLAARDAKYKRWWWLGL